MTPLRRNGLAALIVVRLGAGDAAAFLVDEDENATETASQGQPATTTTTATTVAGGPATSAPPSTLGGNSAPSTTTTVAAAPTTAPASGTGATTTTIMTRQPNTGGPGTLLPGLVATGAGLAGLRLSRRRRPPVAHPPRTWFAC